MKAVVVGAGATGTALSRELAGRGWEVCLLAASAPGTAGASSAQTRLFRVGHEQDTLVELALRAQSDWRELEAETGRRLFFETGLLERYGTVDRARPQPRRYNTRGSAEVLVDEQAGGGRLANPNAPRPAPGWTQLRTRKEISNGFYDRTDILVGWRSRRVSSRQ